MIFAEANITVNLKLHWENFPDVGVILKAPGTKSAKPVWLRAGRELLVAHCCPQIATRPAYHCPFSHF